jgi:hypothetical protein
VAACLLRFGLEVRDLADQSGGRLLRPDGLRGPEC